MVKGGGGWTPCFMDGPFQRHHTSAVQSHRGLSSHNSLSPGPWVSHIVTLIFTLAEAPPLAALSSSLCRWGNPDGP